MSNTKAKPFLKWAGGKTQLLQVFEEFYPEDLEKGAIKKYVEPFVGAGAVLFDLLSRYKFQQVIINDVNKELIITYRVIKDRVEKLINKLNALQNEYNTREKEQKKEMFYEKRNEFNTLKVKKRLNKNDELIIASLVIFLNRTCFNGLYRENKKGFFNVPFNSAKSLNFDIENLQVVSKCLENVVILCGDFSKTLKYVDTSTFVYADPPYRPLNKTSGFTDYNKLSFDDKEQERLAKWLKDIANIGAKFMLSNSDPQGINEKDEFFQHLYGEFKINKVQATRSINSDSTKRGKVGELLINNWD